ncbi:MAG: hypothetical protein M1453_13675 [Acidobacteria bacterium]|nr:hypothetical protein [Acidobacteriota bacterium]MCL5289028.1 hypothetical protein [Acidobacteriota bacterium]
MEIVDRPAWLFVASLIALLAAVEVGFRLGMRSEARGEDQLHEQLKGARNGLVTLVSFLLGFMLPMSLSRFDLRKHLVIEEAKAIGTTAFRAQMLPDPVRSRVRDLMKEYAEVRLKFFDAGLNNVQLEVANNHARRLQNELWKQSVTAAQTSPTPITAIFAQSLNQMIDLSEERLAALENRIPASIWVMLVLISLLTCLTVGYSLRRRTALAMLVSPLAISIVLALAADLDSPRTGVIRISQQSVERVRTDLQGLP